MMLSNPRRPLQHLEKTFFIPSQWTCNMRTTKCKQRTCKNCAMICYVQLTWCQGILLIYVQCVRIAQSGCIAEKNFEDAAIQSWKFQCQITPCRTRRLHTCQQPPGEGIPIGKHRHLLIQLSQNHLLVVQKLHHFVQCGCKRTSKKYDICVS